MSQKESNHFFPNGKNCWKWLQGDSSGVAKDLVSFYAIDTTSLRKPEERGTTSGDL